MADSLTAMGIDLSTRETGICIVKTNVKTHSINLSTVIRLRGAIHGRTVPGRGKRRRSVKWEEVHPVERLIAMRERVLAIHDQHEPDIVFIEGYAYAARAHTYLAFVAECGGMVKGALIERGTPYVVVSPSMLKKFACGRGNCKKDVMVDFANLLIDADAKTYIINDNEADAIMLAAFGACMLGSEWIGRKGKVKKWPSYCTECVKRFDFPVSGSTVLSYAEMMAKIGSK